MMSGEGPSIVGNDDRLDDNVIIEGYADIDNEMVSEFLKNAIFYFLLAIYLQQI